MRCDIGFHMERASSRQQRTADEGTHDGVRYTQSRSINRTRRLIVGLEIISDG
jgi:hypothetical protein